MLSKAIPALPDVQTIENDRTGLQDYQDLNPEAQRPITFLTTTPDEDGDFRQQLAQNEKD